NGKFTVQLPEKNSARYIKVIDVMGQIIYQYEIKNNIIELNLKVAPGNYYVKLESETSLGVKKIIIE
ncbi:MAG: T9SS type A sorting domain-containing protein, partial [Bacteroidia bacterium]